MHHGNDHDDDDGAPPALPNSDSTLASRGAAFDLVDDTTAFSSAEQPADAHSPYPVPGKMENTSVVSSSSVEPQYSTIEARTASAKAIEARAPPPTTTNSEDAVPPFGIDPIGRLLSFNTNDDVMAAGSSRGASDSASPPRHTADPPQPQSDGDVSSIIFSEPHDSMSKARDPVDAPVVVPAATRRRMAAALRAPLNTTGRSESFTPSAIEAFQYDVDADSAASHQPQQQQQARQSVINLIGELPSFQSPIVDGGKSLVTVLEEYDVLRNCRGWLSEAHARTLGSMHAQADQLLDWQRRRLEQQSETVLDDLGSALNPRALAEMFDAVASALDEIESALEPQMLERINELTSLKAASGENALNAYTALLFGEADRIHDAASQITVQLDSVKADLAEQRAADAAFDLDRKQVRRTLAQKIAAVEEESRQLRLDMKREITVSVDRDKSAKARFDDVHGQLEGLLRGVEIFEELKRDVAATTTDALGTLNRATDIHAYHMSPRQHRRRPPESAPDAAAPDADTSDANLSPATRMRLDFFQRTAACTRKLRDHGYDLQAILSPGRSNGNTYQRTATTCFVDPSIVLATGDAKDLGGIEDVADEYFAPLAVEAHERRAGPPAPHSSASAADPGSSAANSRSSSAFLTTPTVPPALSEKPATVGYLEEEARRQAAAILDEQMAAARRAADRLLHAPRGQSFLPAGDEGGGRGGGGGGVPSPPASALRGRGRDDGDAPPPSISDFSPSVDRADASPSSELSPSTLRWAGSAEPTTTGRRSLSGERPRLPTVAIPDRRVDSARVTAARPSMASAGDLKDLVPPALMSLVRDEEEKQKRQAEKEAAEAQERERRRQQLEEQQRLQAAKDELQKAKAAAGGGGQQDEQQPAQPQPQPQPPQHEAPASKFPPSVSAVQEAPVPGTRPPASRSSSANAKAPTAAATAVATSRATAQDLLTDNTAGLLPRQPTGNTAVDLAKYRQPASVSHQVGLPFGDTPNVSGVVPDPVDIDDDEHLQRQYPALHSGGSSAAPASSSRHPSLSVERRRPPELPQELRGFSTPAQLATPSDVAYVRPHLQGVDQAQPHGGSNEGGPDFYYPAGSLAPPPSIAAARAVIDENAKRQSQSLPSVFDEVRSPGRSQQRQQQQHLNDSETDSIHLPSAEDYYRDPQTGELMPEFYDQFPQRYEGGEGDDDLADYGARGDLADYAARNEVPTIDLTRPRGGAGRGRGGPAAAAGSHARPRPKGVPKPAAFSKGVTVPPQKSHVAVPKKHQQQQVVSFADEHPHREHHRRPQQYQDFVDYHDYDSQQQRQGEQEQRSPYVPRHIPSMHDLMTQRDNLHDQFEPEYVDIGRLRFEQGRGNHTYELASSGGSTPRGAGGGAAGGNNKKMAGLPMGAAAGATASYNAAADRVALASSPPPPPADAEPGQRPPRSGSASQQQQQQHVPSISERLRQKRVAANAVPPAPSPKHAGVPELSAESLGSQDDIRRHLDRLKLDQAEAVAKFRTSALQML